MTYEQSFRTCYETHVAAQRQRYGGWLDQLFRFMEKRVKYLLLDIDF